METRAFRALPPPTGQLREQNKAFREGPGSRRLCWDQSWTLPVHFCRGSLGVSSLSLARSLALGLVVTTSLYGRSARTLTRAKWRRRNRARRSRGGNGRNVPKPLCALCDLNGLRFVGQKVIIKKKQKTNKLQSTFILVHLWNLTRKRNADLLVFTFHVLLLDLDFSQSRDWTT